MRRAIFLDRDGVINRVILKKEKPYSPRKFEEFELCHGVEGVLKKFREEGFLNIIVTNQPDITRQSIEWEELNKMHNYIKKHLPIDGIMVCPHDDYHNCECRKPKPGMLFKAANDFEINLKDSFFIGDSWKDIEAGRRAGCRTVLIDAVYNQNVLANFRIKDLSESLEIIST